MDGYLLIGGWSGVRRVPVEIVSETTNGIEIKARARAFLPGRGMLQKGQSTLVPKAVVKAAAE